MSQQFFSELTEVSRVLRAMLDRDCSARNMMWIQTLGYCVFIVNREFEYKQCWVERSWHAKWSFAVFRDLRSSIVHLTGNGILTHNFSMYALILSRCFSQKCWTVSRIG